jgi:hypothetical protein
MLPIGGLIHPWEEDVDHTHTSRGSLKVGPGNLGHHLSFLGGETLTFGVYFSLTIVHVARPHQFIVVLDFLIVI